MPAAVPKRGAELAYSTIVSGQPVTGSTWNAAAAQYNHLAGGGSAIMPLHALEVVIAPGSSQTFQTHLRPRWSATHRMWVMTAYSASGTADVTFTMPNGTTGTARVTTATYAWVPFYEVLDDLDRGGTDDGVELDFTIANDAASVDMITVAMLGCYELPRAELRLRTDADRGVSTETLRAGLPIFDDGSDLFAGSEGVGLYALTGSVDFSHKEHCRRTGMFFGHPFASTSSGSFSSPFVQPFVLRARKLYTSSTTGPVRVSAWVRADGGTGGEVRFTMASGDTLTLTIPVASAGEWIAGDIDVDCDDFVDDYGRRSSRWDTCTVEYRVSSGGGSVYLDHVTGGEKTIV